MEVVTIGKNKAGNCQEVLICKNDKKRWLEGGGGKKGGPEGPQIVEN